MALALSCALPITAQGDHTTPPEGVKSTATKRAAPASELRALAYQLLTIRPSDAETEIKALLKDTDDAVDLSKLAQDIRKFPSRLSDLKVQDSKGIFRPEGLAGPANETLANRLRIAWETARRRVEERANAAEPPRVFKNRAEYQEAIRQEVAKILKVADKDPVLQRVLELVAGDPAEILRRLGEQEKNREQKKAALTPEEDFALHLALAFFVTPQVRALKEAASISMSSAVLLLHGAEKSEDVESRAAVLIAKLAGLNADSRAATFKAVLDQFQVFDVDRPRVKFAGGSFGDVVFANASALVAALRSKELPKPTSGKGETLAVPESLPKSSGDPAFAQKILDRAKAAFAKATKTHGLLEANGTLLRKEGSLKAALEGKDSAKLHEYFDAAVEALSLVGTTPEKRDRLLTEFVCGTSWEKAFVLWSKEKKNPCEGRSAVANALKLGADPEKNSEAHQAKVRKALNNFAEAPEADGSPVGAAGPSGISQGEGPAGAEGPVAAPVRPYRGPKSGLAVREEESLAGGAALGGFGFGGSGGRSAVAAISEPPAPPTPAQVRLEDTDRDDGEAPRFGLARPATTPSPTETSPRPRVVTATPSPTPSPTRATASPTPSPTANGKSPSPTPTPMPEPTKPLFTPTPTETPTDVLPPIGALLNFNQTDGHTLVDASGRTIAVDPRTGSPLPGSQPAGAVQRRPAAAAAVPAIASGNLATSALTGAAVASPPVANVFVVNNPAPSVGVDNRALSSALAGKFSLDAASAKGGTVGGDRTRPVGMQSSYPPVGDGSGAWTPWKYGVITEPRVRPIYDPDNYRNLLWYESSRASENRPTEEQAKALKATELKARRSEFEADPMKGADKLRVVESATFVDKNGKVRGQAELRESSDGKDKLMRVAEVDPHLKGKVVRRRTERVTQLPNGAVVQVVVQFDEIYDAEGAAPRVVNKTITTTTVDKNHTVITKVQRVNQTTGEVTTSTTVQSNDTKFDWATFVQGLKAKR